MRVIGVVKDFNYSSLYTRGAVGYGYGSLIIADRYGRTSILRTHQFQKWLCASNLVICRPPSRRWMMSGINFTGGENSPSHLLIRRWSLNTRKILTSSKIIATVLAIVIGSLGLYGLASLSMQNRNKRNQHPEVLGAPQRISIVAIVERIPVPGWMALLLSVPITWYPDGSMAQVVWISHRYWLGNISRSRIDFTARGDDYDQLPDNKNCFCATGRYAKTWIRIFGLGFSNGFARLRCTKASRAICSRNTKSTGKSGVQKAKLRLAVNVLSVFQAGHRPPKQI